MQKIILATHNVGKVVEFQHLLAPFQLQIVSQAEFHIASVEETGLSFIENAILKARHAAQHTGLPAIADDSGLEVEALQGAPGIHSARYAGKQHDSQANIHKLLAQLDGVSERRARFRCVLALMRHPLDPSPVIGEGSWEGEILAAPRGDKGFGYDPIFWVPEYHCSAAELEIEIKNRLSHRRQALQQLLSQLEVS